VRYAQYNYQGVSVIAKLANGLAESPILPKQVSQGDTVFFKLSGLPALLGKQKNARTKRA